MNQDEKSSTGTVIGCLVAAGVLFAGWHRAITKNTDTYMEIFLMFKEAILWILAVIVLLVLLAAIIFIIKAACDKFEGLYVMLDRSQQWCNEMHRKFDEMEKTRQKLIDHCDNLSKYVNTVSSVVDEHTEDLKKLQATPTLQAEVQAQNAEDEFTGTPS